MVMKKSINQYMSRIGQNTGTSKMLRKVMKNAVTNALHERYQNLNSGRRRTNGLYSSFPFEGLGFRFRV
jgi:hypothetical protein